MKRNKYKYLFKNTIWFTISSFSSKVLNIILVPLYTRVLSTEEFGIADFITITSNLLIFVITLNIADAVLRFSITDSEIAESIFGFGLRIIIKGNLIFLGGLLIVSWFNPLKWPQFFYVFLFFNVLVLSFNNIINSYLRATDKVKDVAILGVISTLVTVISNLFTLLVLKIGIFGFLISLIIGPLSSVIYGSFKCGNIVINVNNTNIKVPLKKEMISYSVPLILNGIAWWINASIDKFYIIGMLGISLSGIYAVSQKIPAILTMISAIFMQAWNLSAIKEFDKNDEDGFFSNTYMNINFHLVLTCSLLILANVFFTKILYSNDFIEAWKASSWLLISVVFSSMSSFIGSVFSAVKKSVIFSISTIISAIVNLILNTVLIPLFGIQGAAASTAISFFSVWIIRYLYSKKYIKWKNNILVDVLVYGLLVVQIGLERLGSDFYLGQILVCLLIIIIYRKNFSNILNKIFGEWIKIICKNI